jgi:hypothetical protein
MNPPPLSPGAADALLFDLGRVVIDIDFNKAFERWAGHAGCEPANLAERFMRDEIYLRHEKGQITDAEFFAGVRAALGVGLSDAQLLEGWNAIFTGEMPGIAALLARAALCLLQHQSRPCRTLLAGLRRRARIFPRNLFVVCNRASETRRGGL